MNNAFWLGIRPGLDKIELNYATDCLATFCTPSF